MKDYYRILEVAQDCDTEEMRRSYRRLAMKFHPDRNQGSPAAERIFKEIAEAYGVLGDPEKRREYDAAMKSGGSTAFQQEDILRGLFSRPEFRQTLRAVFNEFRKAGLRHDPNFVEKSFFGGKGGAIAANLLLAASRGGRRLFGFAGRRLLQAAPVLAAAAGGTVRKILDSAKPPPENIPPPEKKDITFRIFLTAKEFAAGKTIHVYSQSRDHKRLRINIPPGSRPGQKLRLVGHGHAGKGDLLLLLLLRKPQTDGAQSA